MTSTDHGQRAGAYLKVFISYSHDSHEHAARVVELANRLGRDGVEPVLDQFIIQPEEGWRTWMERHIRKDDFVLMVCTERYLRRIRKEEEPGVGLGVQWEGALIYNHIYGAGTVNKKFIPIYLDRECQQYVPDVLTDWNHYCVGEEQGYHRLLAHLAGVTTAQPVPLGPPLQTRPALWLDRPPAPDRFDLGGVLRSGAVPLGKVASPAHYLIAGHQVVPFKGRERELDGLDRWAEDGRSKLAARLIHGPGGMGKTRLAIEWTRRLRERGWDAGFISGDVTPEAVGAIMSARRPAAVIVDYAEVRPGLGDLLKAMAQARELDSGPERVRLLLLARNAGDWWASLRQRSNEIDALLCDSARPLPLLTIYARAAERAEEFERAARAFAEAKKIEYAEAATVPLLDHELYSRLLYVHIGALMFVEEGVFPEGDPLDKVLDHEARFWLRHAGIAEADHPDSTIFRRQVKTALSAITLRGGAANQDELGAVIKSVLPDLPDIPRLSQLLEDIYPDASGHAFISPLEPDLLGEHLVFKTLTDPHTHHSAAGFQPAILSTVPPLVPPVVPPVFNRRPLRNDFLESALISASPSNFTHAFIVLGRIELRHPEEGRRFLHQLLDPDINSRAMPAFEAALALGKETAHSMLGLVLTGELEKLPINDGLPIAHEMENQLPDQTVSLSELAVWVLSTILASIPNTEAGIKQRVPILSNFANRLSDLGRHEEALEATLEVEVVIRKLALTQPNAFLRHLATSLNNLGTTLSDLGRREEALKPVEESVDIRRSLVQSRPDVFLPDLAVGLSNLGSILDDIGRYEEALTAVQESLEIHRALAQARPDDFMPDLATSLNNIVRILRDNERHEDALKAAQEAVEIRRALVHSRPDAFLPVMALALDNEAAILIELNRPQAALNAINEAIEIHRALAQARPEAFLPHLAMSLSNKGATLSNLDQIEEALNSEKEAVEIRRSLAQTWPEAFIPDLALSLGVLGSIHWRLDAVGEARAAWGEALGLLWPLFERLPTAFAQLAVKLLKDYSSTFSSDPPPEARELMMRYAKVLKEMEER